MLCVHFIRNINYHFILNSIICLQCPTSMKHLPYFLSYMLTFCYVLEFQICVKMCVTCLGQETPSGCLSNCHSIQNARHWSFQKTEADIQGYSRGTGFDISELVQANYLKGSRMVTTYMEVPMMKIWRTSTRRCGLSLSVARAMNMVDVDVGRCIERISSLYEVHWLERRKQEEIPLESQTPYIYIIGLIIK